MATLPFADLKSVTRTSPPEMLQTPQRVLGIVVLLGAIIFFSELVVMMLLMAYPIEAPLLEAFVDSAVLVLIISPALYVLFYIPVRRRVETLLATKREIRALSQKLMQATEDEQRRVALDLHDEFGQTLSLMKLEIEALGESIHYTSPQLQSSCALLQQRIREMSTSVHQIAARLRPTLLDDLGIKAALENLVSDFSQRYEAIEFDLMVTGLKARPHAKLETAIYRICQEALTNAVTHAAPSRIEIRLTSSFPELILLLRDNGCGFDTRHQIHAEQEVHLGLLGMRERATSLGGSFTLNSRSGQGTTLRAVFTSEVHEDGC